MSDKTSETENGTQETDGQPPVGPKTALVSIVGRPSAGKSTFEGQTSRSVALGGGRVARCLLDMPANELLSRDLAALCFVGVKRIK